MQCHDVQRLLAFMNRKYNELDAAERAAMFDHIEKCSDCAAIFSAESRADERLGTVMRDVPVPATLKQQVLADLATERRHAHWKTLKRGSMVAVAAALLIAFAGVGTWYARLPMTLSNGDLDAYRTGVEFTNRWDQARAKEYLSLHGLAEGMPTYFDYTWLQYVEVVEFKGRPVAKLTFMRGADVASVFVLADAHFRTDNLIADPTWLQIVPGKGVTYVIMFRGSPESMRPIEIAA